MGEFCVLKEKFSFIFKNLENFRFIFRNLDLNKNLDFKKFKIRFRKRITIRIWALKAGTRFTNK